MRHAVLFSGVDVTARGIDTQRTNKTRFGQFGLFGLQAPQSIGQNEAQTHPADVSVAVKRRLLTLVALRVKKVALRDRCGRCALHL